MAKTIRKILLLLIAFLVISVFNIRVYAADNSKQLNIKNYKKTITVNQTTKIKTNYSSKNLKWRSSNEKIASVDKNGKVKGKKAGTVKITITSKKDKTIKKTIKIKVKNNYTDSDLRYMASIIYSEAGNQCYAGKKAVGVVVMNRVRSKVWPNTIKDVLYQSGQFGPARNGSLNKSLSLYDSKKLNKDCIKAAKEVLNGDTTIVYNKKKIDMKDYYYFSGYVSNCRLQIQDHQFK